MTEPHLTNREDPRLQADPMLSLSDGPATLGLKLFVGIAAIIVVLGTLYGLTYRPRGGTFIAVPGTVLPEAPAQGR